MSLGLDIVIKFKSTTNFDISAVLLIKIFFVIIITLLSLLRFSYFVTPYDAQASSAFSALIINRLNADYINKGSLRPMYNEEET